MADIVNLRMARKAKTRAGAEQKAAENRAAFGQSKAGKKARAAEAERASRVHAAGKIETGKPAPLTNEGE